MGDFEGAAARREASFEQLRQTATDEEVAEKWQQIAPLINRLAERVATLGEFDHGHNSALAGDDRATKPYNTSHAFAQSLSAAVDHLHGAKVLVHDAGMLHLGASSTLARSALENAATAWWLLHPTSRDERVLRTLRWYSRNFRDQHSAVDKVPSLAGQGRSLEEKLDGIRAVAAGRGLDPVAAVGGYRMSTVVGEHAQVSGMGTLFLWQLTSGFAHGRPWAYLGVLEREEYEDEEPGVTRARLTNTVQFGLHPPLTALLVLQDSLRVWESRAGVQHRG